MVKSFFTTSIISIFLTFMTIVLPSSALGQEDKKVFEAYLIPNLLNSYNSMIEGHDIFDLEDWQNLELERHTMEILIFNVAPILGGCECEIVLKPYESNTPHGRSLEQVRDGHEVSHPISIFSGDSRIGDELYTSEPILDAEDFFVGLYTHEKRFDVLNKTTEAEIRELRFIAGQDWEIDNAVLDNLGLNRIAADDWGSVIYMLMDGRADVVMQPFFSSDDLGFNDGDGNEKFIPIPNVKMAFPQSRVYFVSKSHPDGAEFINYLNNGIAILKKDDNILHQAHVWAGVINPKTDDFEVLFKQ